MAVADRHGLPVSICIDSATPHEVRLATSTLIRMVVPEAPQNLRQYGIELIAPHRTNRKNLSQDLRRMRRYRRRWKIERLFAWLQNFRRVVVRYERYAENFLGMLYLALGAGRLVPATVGSRTRVCHVGRDEHKRRALTSEHEGPRAFGLRT